ncbi:MAG: tetratricopeptide repeat protein, partial [Candidatus Neomarinimicrobiota bacterium]|nr:tetratricopeptide repeat protein [Candidatus Neomarinimicrobiota bacterium]
MKFNRILFLIIFSLSSTILIAVDDKGVRYFKEGDFEKALEYYESILRKQIDNKEAQFGLGTTSFQIQDFIASEEAFKQVLESEDTELQSKAHYNLGNLYFQNQKLEESL